MFNPSDDGGEDANICTVKVQPRSVVDGKANACLVFLDACLNLDVLAAGADGLALSAWLEMFEASGALGERTIDQHSKVTAPAWALPKP